MSMKSVGAAACSGRDVFTHCQTNGSKNCNGGHLECKVVDRAMKKRTYVKFLTGGRRIIDPF